MHPADGQVVARARSAELLLDVTQLRIVIAEQKRAEECVIQRCACGLTAGGSPGWDVRVARCVGSAAVS